MLLGSIDRLGRDRVQGWVRDPAHPEAPVGLLITAGGRLLGRVVANRFRGDLVAAGVGEGRFGFDVAFNPPLSPARSWLVHVRAEADGRDVPGSPVRLQASAEFDGAARRAFAAALNGFGTDKELDERLLFLSEERDRLLQRRADRLGLRGAAAGEGDGQPCALVIDHAVPRPEQDAGSGAVVSHMRSLRRLGYRVVFAARDMGGGADAAALEAEGITCCGAPWYASVEEVLRRQAGRFALVYLHRVSVAAAYGTLVRQTQARARVVYSVADLHHLRLFRQAEAEDRPELLPEAGRLREMELWCARMSDAVITHSATEAALLRSALEGCVPVHVVTWSMAPSLPGSVPGSVPGATRRRAFAERSGAALLGHFAHHPNVAAAAVLREEIAPLLDGVPCLLVGAGLPEGLRADAPGVRYAGHVESLDDLFDSVRLTVAPLPFGAGLKGKVVASFSAGVPCVCYPMAAEGMDLPPRLEALVVADAAGAARLMRRLHEDEAFNERMGRRCLAFARRRFSDAAVDAAMRGVVG